MSILSEISELSKQISEKSKSSIIFDQKCNIVSSILRDIIDVLDCEMPNEKTH